MPSRARTNPCWSLCVMLGLTACDRVDAWTSSSGPHEQGAARIGGEVLSTVDGVAITVADVQRVVDATGLSPREALSRLQSEALLIGEASRRGYASHDESRHVKLQAQVQALLAHDIESIQATEEEIAAELKKEYKRFHTPEKRASLHVLARLSAKASAEEEAAAKAFAEEAVRAFGHGADPDEVMADLLARPAKMQVIGEHLHAVADGEGFVKPFLDALYSIPGVGPVPVPIKTQFGWHAIYVTQVVPPTATPTEEARATVRKEIETRKRQAALKTLIASLRADQRVVEDASGKTALTKLEF